MFFKISFYDPGIRVIDLFKFFFITNAKERLGAELRRRFTSDNIVLLGSARQGIELALRAIGIGAGDEVIVPAFVCRAVPDAVIRAGATPVFCDTGKDSFNMSAESLVRLISPNTRAVILVYIFGVPANIEEFREICAQRGIVLIEDCAHTIAGSWRGKTLGTNGDFAVFSFGISKNIAGFGGGAVLCRKNEHYEVIQEAVNAMPKRSAWAKYFQFLFAPLIFSRYFYWLFANIVENYAIAKRNEDKDAAFLSAISEPEAKVALLKLSEYERNLKLRQNAADIYRTESGNLLSFPSLPANGIPDHPYLPVFGSKELFVKLRQFGLPVRRVDYGYLEDLPEFKKLIFQNDNEKQIRENYFLLPLNYSPKTIKCLCQRIKKLL